MQIEIGTTKNQLTIIEPEETGVGSQIADVFSDELNQFIKEIKTARIDQMVKARKLVSLIHSHLQYDKDDFNLDALYKQNRSQYFVKIWENKKAKCDEANTMAVRALIKAGFIARFVSGHSVQTKSEQGEALLLDNNRHAWLEVWDKENKVWVKLDATPVGDPNIDEEEQEQDLSEDEGDYGEREVEMMSEEELDKVMKELEKKEKEELQKPEVVFAREAGCMSEEAKQVLSKIADLREKYKQELRESHQYWQRVLRENIKEAVVYSGPVKQSEGDELDDVVEARLDLLVGDDDPGGFEKEFLEKRKEKIFGGYEVYIMVDMSGSMADYLYGVKKVEAQRDMVFLLLDNIMISAVLSRKAERNLKTPLPNKVCLTVFGEKTENILPVTDKWGPVEQIRVYQALDMPANGSTPDDVALQMIKKQIEISQTEEAKQRKKVGGKKAEAWQIRRFVIATADGGSNNFAQVKRANDSLQVSGIPVDLFLFGVKENTNLLQATRQAYQSVSLVPEVSDLARQGLNTLTKRIKEIYEK